MKLKKYVGFLMGAAVMLTGCMSTSADDELTPQEKELKAVRSLERTVTSFTITSAILQTLSDMPRTIRKTR